MQYVVTVVEDHELPSETDWVIATRGGRSYLLIKRARFSIEGGLCAVLAAAWGAWECSRPLEVAV